MKQYKKPFVIKREELSSINEVLVRDVSYDLGILKDFEQNDKLKDFLNGKTNFSIAWTALTAKKTLLPHLHPVDTMVIMCNGNAILTGDNELDVSEGDIICIPKRSWHGFKSKKDKGFWSISLAFAEKGLYHNEMIEFGEKK